MYLLSLAYSAQELSRSCQESSGKKSALMCEGYSLARDRFAILSDRLMTILACPNKNDITKFKADEPCWASEEALKSCSRSPLLLQDGLDWHTLPAAGKMHFQEDLAVHRDGGRLNSPARTTSRQVSSAESQEKQICISANNILHFCLRS